MKAKTVARFVLAVAFLGSCDEPLGNRAYVSHSDIMSLPCHICAKLLHLTRKYGR